MKHTAGPSTVDSHSPGQDQHILAILKVIFGHQLSFKKLLKLRYLNQTIFLDRFEKARKGSPKITQLS